MNTFYAIAGFIATASIGSFLALGMISTDLVKWSYSNELEIRTILAVIFCSALYFWETRKGEEGRPRRDLWKIASIVAAVLISADLISARLDYSIEHSVMEAGYKNTEEHQGRLEVLERMENSLGEIEGALVR